MDQNPAETAINAAWKVLSALEVPDGLLGVFYLEERETFVLHYEEEGSNYSEWVRLGIRDLEQMPVALLEEAAQRLAQRICITRPRHVQFPKLPASELN